MGRKIEVGKNIADIIRLRTRENIMVEGRRLFFTSFRYGRSDRSESASLGDAKGLFGTSVKGGTRDIKLGPSVERKPITMRIRTS